MDYSAYPSAGFLNVTTAPGTDSGWVIRNLPVDPSSGYPGMSTMFDLGNTPGTPVSELFAYVEFSTTPRDSFPGLTLTPYSIGRLPHNPQGRGIDRPAPPGVRVDARVVTFTPGALTKLTWQTGHPNIEQDKDQCYPASVANSLQWLKFFNGTPVPDPHRPGIRDNSLVGKLDLTMLRPAHTVVNDPPALEGKLDYIGNAGLRLFLSVRHKNRPGAVCFPNNNVTKNGVTSVLNNGAISLTDWMISEVEKGSDVELGIDWDGGGGHVVDLIGGGYILGVPWVAWVHDANQGFVPGVPDPLKTAINGGISWFDGGIEFSPIVNNKMVAYIGGKTLTGTIGCAIAESDTKLGAPDLRSLPGQGYCQLSWPSVPGAASYNIYRSTATGLETLFTTTSSSQYLDSGLSNGTAYYYQVDATDGQQTSPVSAEVSCTPGTLAYHKPYAPGLFSSTHHLGNVESGAEDSSHRESTQASPMR